MKISIVGTGNMGRVLGLALAEKGHQVYFGARDLERAERASRLSKFDTQFGTNQQAADFGDVVFYNPRDVDPRDVVPDVSAMDGKIVIDFHNGSVPPGFAFDPVVESRAEVLQRQLPRAKVVKAFNTITQEIFEHANRGLEQYRIACFIASDDASSSKQVMALAASMGFEAVECGALRQARLLESAADLLRMLLYKQNSPWSSFSLVNIEPVHSGRLGGREESRLSNRSAAKPN